MDAWSFNVLSSFGLSSFRHWNFEKLVSSQNPISLVLPFYRAEWHCSCSYKVGRSQHVFASLPCNVFSKLGCLLPSKLSFAPVWAIEVFVTLFEPTRTSRSKLDQSIEGSEAEYQRPVSAWRIRPQQELLVGRSALARSSTHRRLW